MFSDDEYQRIEKYASARDEAGRSSPEMFRFAQMPDEPCGNGLWVYSIITNDKAKKYNSETNNLPFDAHHFA